MASLHIITGLKEKVDRLRAKSEQAKGAAQVIRKTLQSDWDCSSLKEARALLDEKTKKAEELQAEFNQEFEAFQAEWADELEAA